MAKAKYDGANDEAFCTPPGEAATGTRRRAIERNAGDGVERPAPEHGEPAGSPDEGGTHRRAPSTWWRFAPSLGPLSGDEFARALVSCGWLPVQWTARTCLLVRDGRQIVVPRHDRLDREIVAELAQQAGLGPLALADVLERVHARSVESLVASTSRRGD